MVFRRRGLRSRRFKRRGGGVKSMARGKVGKFTRLARAVRTLQKKNRSEAEYLNFSQNFTNVNLNSTTPLEQGLSYFSGMVPLFGTSSDDTSDNKIIHKSVGMDIRVTLENTVNNEEETIGFTAFLFSLRDAIGPYFLPGTGAIQWTNNVTHTIQNGMCLLNKKMFKIHKVKRFHLTNYGTALATAAAQSQYGTDMRWYWKQPINKVIQNPAGNWKSLNSALDPSKTYYVVVFSDNSVADAESPCMSMTCVHTFKTVA